MASEPEPETAIGTGAVMALTYGRSTRTVDPLGRPLIDIHAIERFKHDPKINELLRTGDTIGCFYVESPAMRMLLKKLGVQDYLTLVAASSIIRPGVSQSGMMREYILRHRDPERRKQAHPAMLKIMPDTYGVMVYQEDVIKVAHLYAGLTLAEADILRRGMSGKYRSREEFQRVKERFFDNCMKKGYPPEESAEIWRQIESFAGYSFAKGHSASYAVESYQSLYLKAYHPLEFMVAVANNFGGFYHTEFYLHEAKRAGAVIEAPCVDRSGELCTLYATGPWPLASGRSDDRPEASSPRLKASIYLGLRNIRSLDSATVERILTDRRRHGPFADLPDLLRRVSIGVEQARMLIRVGAFRFTGKSKPELLWDLTLLHPGAKAIERSVDLFITKTPQTKLPELQHFDLSDAYDELELLGFPLCDPFLLVKGGSDEQVIGQTDDLASPKASRRRSRLQTGSFITFYLSARSQLRQLFTRIRRSFNRHRTFPSTVIRHPSHGKSRLRLQHQAPAHPPWPLARRDRHRPRGETFQLQRLRERYGRTLVRAARTHERVLQGEHRQTAAR